jgi:hypothetical protein
VDCQLLENAMLSSGSRKKGQSYRSGSPATAHLLPQGLPHFGAEMIPGFPIWHNPPVFLAECLDHKKLRARRLTALAGHGWLHQL